MDFSRLLSRKLEQKRQKSAERATGPKKSSASHPQASNESSGPVPSGSPDDNGAGDASAEKAKLLQSIDREELQKHLGIFQSADNAALSKEEQLQTLEIHVKQEKKDLRYKEYLDRENEVQDLIDVGDIVGKNFDKLALQVRKFFKHVLGRWADNADEDFPESLLRETKRDIVKLLYKLRSKKLSSDVLTSLATIVYYVQTEQMVRANEAYLQLSIGNVAWPIGVRDVGIHARAADARIAGDDKRHLSNIMKSEATRRWLIAVKRIVNYCEMLHRKT